MAGVEEEIQALSQCIRTGISTIITPSRRSHLHHGTTSGRRLTDLQAVRHRGSRLRQGDGELRTLFIPRRNVVYERAMFNTRSQLETETVEEYVTALHGLATTCNYGPLKEELIRDRLIVGLRDSRTSEKLQLDPDLDLQKAITAARQSEVIKKQQAELRPTKEKDANVDRIAAKNGTAARPAQRGTERSNVRTRSKKTATPKPKGKPCRWCGREAHPRSVCPAKNAGCNRCKKKGHFVTVCKSSTSVNSLVHEQGFVGAAASPQTAKWDIEIFVDETPVVFRIDTGADETVLPAATFQKVFAKCHKLSEPQRRLHGPDGRPLKVMGSAWMKLNCRGQQALEEVYIVKGLRKPLLGKPAIEKFRLCPQICMTANKACEPKKEFSHLFQGLGSLEGAHVLKLKPNATPFAIASPRRVPLSLYRETQKELENMQSQGVISPVEEPTEWCAPMVIVPKPPGKIRICVDLTQLNKHIQREYHPIPSVEHTLGRLAGAKIFSKLDANSGFWQIPLDEKSRLLTTFITPFGRFCFNRLPFGITSAPEHFQRRITQLLQGMEGVLCHMDDILIWASSSKQHEQRLREVLRRLSSAGLTLNEDKCVFRVRSIKFLGHQVDSDGVRPDETIVNAVKEMPIPTSKQEVKRIMGMATYLGRFVPHLSDLLHPLSSLLSSKVDFVWDHPQQKAFTKWKEILSTCPVLGIYDANKRSIVSADASSYGLGAVLRQEQEDGSYRVIAYASRTLTETEKRYAQIEKEGLALTWAFEKFRDYIVGTHFVLETDHKPLISLFGSKSLDDLTPRLQRLRMRLMRYSFEVVHVPGKELQAADSLSRSPLPQRQDREMQEEIDCFIRHIETSLPATQTSLQWITAEQNKDPVCQRLASYSHKGWPNRRGLGTDLKEYYEYRHHIAVQNSLLMNGSRIVVPESCRPHILQQLHEGHMGIGKCKARANVSVWWPRINDHIERLVKNCEKCIKTGQNRKLPLIPSEFPSQPWERVAMDLFFIHGKWWLVVVDYYSRYPEIARLESLTAACVIMHCKSIFARHGIPEVVVSDNGPQFSGTTGSAFTKFSQTYGFKHITSSPRYAQSNGMAEAAVKIIKRSLSKTEDPYETLMIYRSTPLPNGYSPIELLMGRRIRTTVPIATQLLEPKLPDQKELRHYEQENRNRQKQYFDRRHGVRQLDPLGSGERVWVIDLKRTGVVQKKAHTPRSYWITSEGQEIRRNRTHLIPFPNQQDKQGIEEFPETTTRPEEMCADTSHKHSRHGRCLKEPDRFSTSSKLP
ncbi:uncharacterized protein ISCGN_002124 [Ixodes scapularis]